MLHLAETCYKVSSNIVLSSDETILLNMVKQRLIFGIFFHLEYKYVGSCCKDLIEMNITAQSNRKYDK